VRLERAKFPRGRPGVRQDGEKMGAFSNCVLTQRWRNALDSRPLIGHPACGLEVSDFDTPKASFVFKA